MSVLISNLNTIESVKLDIKSAIEAKGVSMSGVSFPDYPSAIASISGGGGGYTEKDITERSYDIVNLNNSASYVPAYTFIEYKLLETVSLPECVSIGESAFRSCTSLTQVNLPVCENIKGSAFQNCTSLTEVILPNCESIANNAFQSCTQFNSLTLCTDVYWTIPYQSRMLSNTPIMNGTGSIYVRNDTYNNWITATGWSSLATRFVSIEYSEPILSFSNGLVYGSTPVLRTNYMSYLGISSTDITEVSLQNCTIMSNSVFQNCTSLSQISLPMCTTIGDYTFYSCTSLSQVSLPNCVSIGGSAFKSCTSLSQVSLPVCEYIGEDAFRYCTSLSQVSLPTCKYVGINGFGEGYEASYYLPVCSYIGNQGFRTYSSITITLGYSSIVELGGTEPFEIMYKRVSIYVPASLVDTYKSANIWSDYANQIFAIPE